MSWSVRLIGKPENVAQAVESYGDKLDGQSKLEFEDSAPHLAALVRENFVADGLGPGYVLPTILLEASGTGSSRNGSQVSRNCTVKIEPIYATPV